ncbi:MAG TPA: glycosyltransferase [Opitutaceae bacterium]|nr:glycosyltransferase [Opitutaceae bacterium]
MSAGGAEPIVHFGLETPVPLAPTQNYFQLVGWAFAAGAPGRCPVRVVVGDRVFLPIETSERPDVAAQFPAEPAARASGFKFIGYLPFGAYLGRLELSVAGRGWVPVRSLAIPVSSHPILGAVEKPAAGRPITEAVRIEGWAHHPEFRIREIVLQFGNVEVPCEYGLERPDVAARFPGQPGAARCGFITAENLPRGAGRVKVRVLTECGRVYYIGSRLEVAIERGWIPKPPPPSPLRDLSTLAVRLADGTPPPPVDGPAAGSRNVLFALYGDFSSNSALHVAALANELIRLGCDCVVAVPDHKETVGALPRADFLALNFDELPHVTQLFKDGRGPRVVHAWTSRENVRRFTADVAARFGSAVLVHLEDNEREILETRVGRPYAELARLPDRELDPLVPDVLTHPRRGPAFLAGAAGVTVIVDRLRDQVPAGRPVHLLWPAADASHFRPRPRDEAFRRRLGFGARDIVLFYHGNTHASNAEEVRALYEAVLLLNRRGLPAHLVRTGRDFPDFLPDGGAAYRAHVIHLGHVGRARRLPELMAVADYFVQPGVPGSFNDYRFPSKLPEFFALGRPVVLPRTNLGGLVRHGQDGWVLERADAAAIADAIAALHADPDLAARLSAGALAFSREHFSWPRAASGLLDFYRSLTPLVPAASS